MYDAFISYSHAADSHFAPKLQASLQAFAKPLWKLRAVRIFRDDSTLELTPQLWPRICAALAASKHFLLLASPGAAGSRWVQDELREWLSNHGGSAQNLLIVLTEGGIEWDRERNDFHWGKTTALPRLLEGKFVGVPLWMDMRWARSKQDLSLRHPQYLKDIARISSALRNVPLDQLIGEDIRAQRVLRAATTAAAITVGVSLAAALVTGWRIRNELQVAEARRQLNESSVLAAEAQQVIDDWARLSDAAVTGALSASQSLLDRGDPYRLEHNQRLREIARVMPGDRRNVVLPNDIAYLTYSRDGSALKVDFKNSTMAVLRGDRMGPLLKYDGRALSFDASLTRIAYSAGAGELQIWDSRTGQSVPQTWTREIRQASLSPSGRLLATLDQKGQLMVRWIDSGKILVNVKVTSSGLDVAFADDDARAVIDVDDGVNLYELQSGSSVPLKEVRSFLVADFSDDGRSVALATACRVRVWDVASRSERSQSFTEDCEDTDTPNRVVRLNADGSRVTVFRGDSGDPLPLTFHVPSGELLWPPVRQSDWGRGLSYEYGDLSGSVVATIGNGAIQARSAESGRVLSRAVITPEEYELAINPLTHEIAVASGSNLQIFSGVGGEQFHEGSAKAVTHVARSVDDRHIAVAGDGSISVWGLQGLLYQQRLETASTIELSADGSTLLHPVAKGFAGARVAPGRVTPLPVFEFPEGKDQTPSLSARGRYAAVVANGHAKVWETATGKVVLDGPKLKSIAFAPDERFVATSDDAGNVAFAALDVSSTPHLPRGGQTQGFDVLMFSPAGRYVVLQSKEGAFRFRDLEAGTVLPGPAPVSKHEPLDFWFTPDDRYLLTTRLNNVTGPPRPAPVAIWDMKQARAVASIPFDAIPTFVAVKAHRAAVAGFRGKTYGVSIIDLESAAELRFIPSAEEITVLALDQEASLLAAGGRSGLLRIWEWPTEAEPVEIARIAHDGAVQHIGFSEDGKTILTAERVGRGDSRFHVWRSSTDALRAHLNENASLFRLWRNAAQD